LKQLKITNSVFIKAYFNKTLFITYLKPQCEFKVDKKSESRDEEMTKTMTEHLSYQELLLSQLQPPESIEASETKNNKPHDQLVSL